MDELVKSVWLAGVEVSRLSVEGGRVPASEDYREFLFK
jgi:hypothetical protein